MKKYYVIFGVLGLMVGYFSKSDFWFEDGRDNFFPITKTQLKAKKSSTPAPDVQAGQLPVIAVAAQGPGAVPADLETLSQFELFHQLYNVRVLKNPATHTIYFEKIKSRLKAKYPVTTVSEHKTNYEKEVANRLGLLRAMSQFWPSPRDVKVNQKEIKNFFHHIAKNKNENFMIRRQAFKSWLSFGNTVSQTEKNKLLAGADSRLLHLVSLSDENLMQALTESAE